MSSEKRDMTLYHGTRLDSLGSIAEGIVPIPTQDIVDKVLSDFHYSDGYNDIIDRYARRREKTCKGSVCLAEDIETAFYYARQGSSLEYILRKEICKHLKIHTTPRAISKAIGRRGYLFYCEIDEDNVYGDLRVDKVSVEDIMLIERIG